jgi:hypothetical protein
MKKEMEPGRTNWVETLQLNLPNTEAALKQWCVQNQMLHPHIRLVPGLRMADVSPIDRKPINGMYGMEQLDAYTRQPVARCGFTVINNTIMDITHTPQGNRPDYLCQQERQRLRSRDFRGQMIGTMIQMAIKMGQTEVRAVYSGDHHEVALGLLRDPEAYWRLDRPFEQFAPTYPFTFEEIGEGPAAKGYWVMRLQ